MALGKSQALRWNQHRVLLADLYSKDYLREKSQEDIDAHTVDIIKAGIGNTIKTVPSRASGLSLNQKTVQNVYRYTDKIISNEKTISITDCL